MNSGTSARELLEDGIALQHNERLTEARDRYQAALDRDPNNADGIHLLGMVTLRLGDTPTARTLLARAVALQPDTLVFLFDQANLLMSINDFPAAAEAFKKLIELKPDHSRAYAGLGDLFRKIEQFDAAERSYRLAVRHDPNLVEALVNLGIIAYIRGNLTDAMVWFEKALRLQPELAAIHGNIALCLTDMGEIGRAVDHSRRALAEKPDYAAARSNLLLTLCYDYKQDDAELLAEHRRWAAVHIITPEKRHRHRGVSMAPERQLRIGYVSPDFRTHSVAYFLEAIFRYHDTAQYAPYCYAEVNVEDEVTRRFRSKATGWRCTCGESDEQFAAAVAEDRIDILVDCAGHMSGNRLAVLGYTPAPVQVTYCGYPCTTGSSWVDFRITDGIADPAGEEQWYTERLWRLDGCFLCYTPRIDAPAVSDPPAIARGYVTFGSFNTLPKVNGAVIAAWASILEAVPGSRLFLKNKALTDAAVRAKVRDAFGKLGIDNARLDLRGHAAGVVEHLACYRQVDLCLDTFPYNGTTTTCEALWMGVPVITFAGTHHRGRVGATLLKAIGGDECVAPRLKEYAAMAIRLSKDITRLSTLRSGLRERMAHSRLCDGAGFTRGIEAAYRRMWRQWCAGEGRHG
jgi:protein O-GlcNAc transferase